MGSQSADSSSHSNVYGWDISTNLSGSDSNAAKLYLKESLMRNLTC
jgi:hypothetical protein